MLHLLTLAQRCRSQRFSYFKMEMKILTKAKPPPILQFKNQKAATLFLVGRLYVLIETGSVHYTAEVCGLWWNNIRKNSSVLTWLTLPSCAPYIYFTCRLRGIFTLLIDSFSLRVVTNARFPKILVERCQKPGY